MSSGKIAGLIVSGIAVAIFVFWWVMVRAPSPQAICKHKIQLVLNEVPQDQQVGADALIMQLELRCVEAAEKKIQFRGKLVYAEYARCVAAAQTLGEAERC
ncbi:hypothetical protein ACNOYE_05765 [Nannocystaceae bacterium ST9]